MNRVTPSHHTERIGVNAVAKKVHEAFGWIFRPQEQDFGIDGQIEVVEGGIPTGKLIAVQIKSGPSYFSEPDATGFLFRGELKHLDYWLQYDSPVIVVLYDPSSDTAYWQSVTPEHVTKTPNAWKMSMPKTQMLQAASASDLETLASRHRELRAALQEFTCPYCGAPLLERAGGDILYEEYACGYLIQDVCRQPCPYDPAFPPLEEYSLEFHDPGPATEKTWLCIPIPATERAKRLRLAPATGTTKEQAEQAIRAEYGRLSKKPKKPH